jgi:hypothetical protein
MQAPVMRPWLHGAIVEFVLCVVALVGVSLMTKPQAAASLAATTINWSGAATPVVARDAFRRSVWADYRIWLSILVTLTAVLWWLMR